MVDAYESVVAIVGAQHAAEIRLRRQSIDRFYLVDGIDIVEHGRVIERRFAPALRFVISINKGLVLLQRSADGGAELVLPQDVRSGSLQKVDRIHFVVT